MVIRFLTVMMKHGYIGEFEVGHAVPTAASTVYDKYIFQVVDDHRAGKIVVNLTDRLNKCGVISPRCDSTQK